jgi:regulator of protease activity HflC (stomatin/prohibitin superfamily)
MKAERNRFVQKLQADGDAQAANIISAANLERDKLLADARATADKIKGEAEKEANESLKVLEQKPDLAIFLIKIKALEDALRDRSTLILDQRTPPFDLLDAGSKSNPKSLVSPGNK